MLSIEIHGLKEEDSKNLESEIFEAFSDRSYADDVVVEIYNTSVRDRKGNLQPFIRLLDSQAWNIQEAVERLEEFGLDIRVMELGDFR